MRLPMLGTVLVMFSASGRPTPHATLRGAAPETAGHRNGVCVLVDGQVREIEAVLDTATGDTLISGRPLAEAYPAPSPPYLAGAEWFVRDEMVVFERRQYVRYGQPRVIRPAVLVRVGEFRGVPLFAPSRAEAVRFVYALVGRNCEFQPYWYAATVGAVRGR